ncbi:MAG: 6-bladed beta-propeller [Gammaproteobacteria bacterium]|nr:MAG: 6-bladed beta-propeller [Gammaproteobacteria bacterium]
MPYQVISRLGLAMLALVLTACASSPEKEAPPPLVFPPPPDQPRFVFERTLKFNEDVVIPDRAERFKRFATGSPRKVRGLVKPFDVAAKDGKVFVTDTVQRKLVMFDVTGGHYLEIGDKAPGTLRKPMGVCISSLNEVFVADITARQIVVFDINGSFLRKLGRKEDFRRPTDVGISPDGKTLYVVDIGGVDTDQHHVVVMDANTGKIKNIIGKRGTADNEFNLPIQIDVATDGSFYVVDKGNFRVKHFSPEGEYLGGFGQPGRVPGSFASPKGIAVGPDNNIYVVDSAFGNIQIFNPDFQLLMYLGTRGEAGYPAKYMLPAGVDVDPDGRIYMVDQFFRKVDIFYPYGMSPMPDIRHPAS